MALLGGLQRTRGFRCLLSVRVVVCFALALGGVSACADEEESGSNGDAAEVDDEGDHDQTDERSHDDQADDDEADDGSPDDDDEGIETPDVDAGGGKKDVGTSSVMRDGGKADASSPSKVDGGVAVDASADASEDAGEDATQEPTPASDAGSDATAETGDASTSSGELCELKAHQVGIMGDSYIDYTPHFMNYLHRTAREAGALGATEQYVYRAKVGAAMENALIKIAEPIPTQLPRVLADSRRRGPEGVKLIIMTGGGNDVLINHMECRRLTAVTEGCKGVVANTLMIMKKLFADMKSAGIEEVIYFWYPDLGVRTGKVINDYSIPLAKETCEGNTDVRCHFVDTRDAFRGHPDWIGPDDIHPTEPGSKAIVNLVWNVMVENCLASK